MIIPSRPALMKGLPQKTDLWARYDSVMGAAAPRGNAYKFSQGEAEMLVDGDGIRNESYKYMQTNPVMLSGLFDSSDGSPAIIDPASVSGTVRELVLAWNMQQIQNSNNERIARGLAPLDASAYAPTVNLGLSNQTMLLIGAAILALFMMRKA